MANLMDKIAPSDAQPKILNVVGYTVRYVANVQPVWSTFLSYTLYSYNLKVVLAELQSSCNSYG